MDGSHVSLLCKQIIDQSVILSRLDTLCPCFLVLWQSYALKLQSLRGPADPTLNPGPLSWDFCLWTLDHGPWAQVSRFTRYFIGIWVCFDVLLVFTRVSRVFAAWTGSRGALGDAWGIIEGSILDKTRERMITCDVLW